jgi:plasmid maintenance system killer protein
MIVGYRHKGLEELQLTGSTRRIGPAYVRKCPRVLQLLDLAAIRDEHRLLSISSVARQAAPLVRASDWELSGHVRLVG